MNDTLAPTAPLLEDRVQQVEHLVPAIDRVPKRNEGVGCELYGDGFQRQEHAERAARSGDAFDGYASPMQQGNVFDNRKA